MAAQVATVAADALIVLGLVVTTLGVAGMFRMPDVYTQLHAASKAVFLGIVAFLIASMADGDGAITARAVLIAVFLLLTTPVGAHAVARAAFQRREPMLTSGALNESDQDLTPAADRDDAQPPSPLR
ncbi:MAG TPA: monovalent cation/H(+) antiporter subunit G [Solirubrobacteraceae bacterium]|jgi:multicomponent Na+:H+ antiporter subunit G|nr:monovalent cation/H(+) antiporter subunit G [Solirubrobacteraceae bacterium]